MPIACASGHYFHSPGSFILTVDCPPYERKESFGLPTYIYPYATVMVQDATSPESWIQIAQHKIESADPITFQVSGLVRLHLGWNFSKLEHWSIEERWIFKKLQVVTPVSDDQVAPVAATHIDGM